MVSKAFAQPSKESVGQMEVLLINKHMKTISLLRALGKDSGMHCIRCKVTEVNTFFNCWEGAMAQLSYAVTCFLQK